MAKLQKLHEETNRAQIGKTLRVLVEESGIARTEWDAPGIDSTVLIDKQTPVGNFTHVTINNWRGYDLIAARQP
jgi:ribosomal protein S12 methylthiotransferase